MLRSRKLLLRTLSVASFAILAHSIASGQTLYGIDGSGPIPTLREYTGPPNPALCSYPNGPVVAAFPATASTLCPGLLPFPLPFDGDIAIDTVSDQVYAADAFTIARYSSNGAVIDSFPSPIFITGMGIDPASPGGPLLWITDGVIYGAVAPPVVPGCFGPPPPFVIGPFPVPPLSGAPITDIDWDPGTGALLACDLGGFVGSFFPGAPAGPPYGVFPVAPGPCPGLGPALTGIALDNSVPGSGTFYVTDGFVVAYLLPGAVPAPTTFYTTVTCNPLTTPPISGLDFSSRPIRYGAGSDASGLNPPPRIGSIGHSIIPNPGFGMTMSGSVPGSTAALLFGSRGAACPAIPFAGVNLLVLPTLGALPVTMVDAGGNAFQSIPLPGTASIGLSVWTQWFVVTPAGLFQMTDAMGVTTGLP